MSASGTTVCWRVVDERNAWRVVVSCSRRVRHQYLTLSGTPWERSRSYAQPVRKRGKKGNSRRYKFLSHDASKVGAVEASVRSRKSTAKEGTTAADLGEKTTGQAATQQGERDSFQRAIKRGSNPHRRRVRPTCVAAESAATGCRSRRVSGGCSAELYVRRKGDE